MGGPLGRGRHVRVRPVEDARPGVRDRHAAADGERVAARRARVLVHPHRHHRPLPAHARSRGLLPDGVGRQRCPDRAPGAELLRRPLRSVPPVRPRLRSPGEAGQAGDPDQPPELRGAVRPARGGGRAEVRGALAHAGPLGRLVHDLHDHRRARPPGVAARVPAQPGPGRGVPVGGPDAVGRRLPHGRLPGGARGPGAAGRLPRGALRRHRRRPRHRDRDDATRADPRVRGAGGAPRRRALRTALRARGRDAPLRRAGPGVGPRPGRSRQGVGHRDDLHLR